MRGLRPPGGAGAGVTSASEPTRNRTANICCGEPAVAARPTLRPPTSRSEETAMTDWPALSYEDWSETCDTLHAHTQVLGKLAVVLAPPEPQLQHAALRLTARGWETGPLPAPDGSGAFVVALDLHAHEALVEHSDGRARRVPLAPNRAVGEVTRDLLGHFGELAG